MAVCIARMTARNRIRLSIVCSIEVWINAERKGNLHKETRTPITIRCVCVCVCVHMPAAASSTMLYDIGIGKRNVT